MHNVETESAAISAVLAINILTYASILAMELQHLRSVLPSLHQLSCAPWPVLSGGNVP